LFEKCDYFDTSESTVYRIEMKVLFVLMIFVNIKFVIADSPLE